MAETDISPAISGQEILTTLKNASVNGFIIDVKTAEEIHKNAHLTGTCTTDFIRDELCELLCGKNVLNILLDYSGVITHIIPQLKPCVGFEQNNRYHKYNVYDHIAHAVASYEGTDIAVRTALLLHDAGKPHCYSEDEKGGHFYGHASRSRDIAEKVLTELNFEGQLRDEILQLILYHDTQIEQNEKSIRRWLNKIGEKQLFRLMDIKEADISAQADGIKSQRLEMCGEMRRQMGEIIERERQFSLKDLAVNGNDIMALGIPAGQKLGRILNVLVKLVTDGKIENERGALTQYIINEVIKNGK